MSVAVCGERQLSRAGDRGEGRKAKGGGAVRV
jgi:hypothetical protein